MNRSKRSLAIAGAVTLSLLAAACGSDDDTNSDTSTTAGVSTTAGGSTSPTTTSRSTESTKAPAKLEAELNASGSTFVQAFVTAGIDAFHDDQAGVTINYGGGGSGKGRQDLADQLVDFAGTDGTIKDADLATYKGGDVLYFPVVVAPVTVSFNLDIDDLQLSAATIAQIFQTKITNWNDPAIAKDNPGVTLPDQAITVVHRAESSGTTANFTKFLDSAAGPKATGEWTLGTDSTVQWPANTVAGQANGGVAQAVSTTKGAIGYVDYSDAVAAKLKFASILNKAGKYVEATIDGASAAAAGAKIADNLTFSAIWADGADAYPITAQTWLIAYKNQTDKAKGEALKGFLEYLLTEGQETAEDVDYAPLPADLATKAIAQLDELKIPA